MPVRTIENARGRPDQMSSLNHEKEPLKSKKKDGGMMRGFDGIHIYICLEAKQTDFDLSNLHISTLYLTNLINRRSCPYRRFIINKPLLFCLLELL